MMNCFLYFLLLFSISYCKNYNNSSFNYYEVFGYLIHLLSNNTNLRELSEKFFEKKNEECVKFVLKTAKKGGFMLRNKTTTISEGIIKSGIADHTIGMELDCSNQTIHHIFFKNGRIKYL